MNAATWTLLCVALALAIILATSAAAGAAGSAEPAPRLSCAAVTDAPAPVAPCRSSYVVTAPCEGLLVPAADLRWCAAQSAKLEAAEARLEVMAELVEGCERDRDACEADGPGARGPARVDDGPSLASVAVLVGGVIAGVAGGVACADGSDAGCVVAAGGAGLAVGVVVGW